MSISIPNKINDLFLTIGFSIIAYSYYETNQLKYKQLDFLNSSNGLDDKVNELLVAYSNDLKFIYYLGIIILIIGVILSIRDYNSNPKKQNEKIFSCCQSCGKKFSSIRANSRNFDKTINYSFCFECYDNGQFTNPNLKIEDLLTESNEMKFNEKFYKTSFKKHLESLERWKETEY